MSVDKIRVNTISLKNDASTINNSIKIIKSNLVELETAALKLDAMWDGPASESFKNSFHNDIKYLSELISNLNTLNNYENNAKTEYENCEKRINSLISSIH